MRVTLTSPCMKKQGMNYDMRIDQAAQHRRGETARSAKACWEGRTVLVPQLHT